jgi:hypothetical protein
MNALAGFWIFLGLVFIGMVLHDSPIATHEKTKNCVCEARK